MKMERVSGMKMGKVTKQEINNFECDIYNMVKAHRAPIHNKKVEKAKEIKEKVHLDLCGPMSVPSIRDVKYLHYY